MIWLVGASLIWAFSFGLIKGLIVGVDPFILGTIRTVVAALFFAPWFILKIRDRLPTQKLLAAGVCGALQIGLMYGPYLLSFKYLQAHEVALYTMTTPLIMALLTSLITRQNFAKLLFASLIATLGGLIAASGKITSIDLQFGVVLVQASNLLFAVGILLWSKWLGEDQHRQTELMFPFFTGAAIASLILSFFFAQDIRPYTADEWIVFIYLGAIASGVGFFMWNRGALVVSTPVLTAANNLKLPIAMIVSLLVFNEQADVPRLGIGLTFIIIALQFARGASRQRTK